MHVSIIRLSKAGKMPSLSFSLPAQACRTGSKLHAVPGSICADCYALKGNYRFPNVKAPRNANLETIRLAQATGEWEPWISGMVGAIAESEKSGYFRWHDSGDVQSLEHLEAIAEIARRMPKIRFWLPTKEKGDLLSYQRKHGDFPRNLTVRLSAPMVDGKPTREWRLTSTVHAASKAQGFECGAYTRGGKCGDCRACWHRSVKNVSYPKH